MTYFEKPKNHQKGKHIEMKYHLICEIVQMDDIVVEKIAFVKNLVDPFIKVLIGRVFDRHRCWD